MHDYQNDLKYLDYLQYVFMGCWENLLFNLSFVAILHIIILIESVLSLLLLYLLLLKICFAETYENQVSQNVKQNDGHANKIECCDVGVYVLWELENNWSPVREEHVVIDCQHGSEKVIEANQPILFWMPSLLDLAVRQTIIIRVFAKCIFGTVPHSSTT